ncbi:MAG: hypothetical protein ACXWUN_07540, partial [Allosphingosinicella sp.]
MNGQACPLDDPLLSSSRIFRVVGRIVRPENAPCAPALVHFPGRCTPLARRRRRGRKALKGKAMMKLLRLMLAGLIATAAACATTP